MPSSFSSSARQPDRPWARRLSSLLFALALIFAALAIYLYIDERNNTGPDVPTPIPGENEYISVVEALRAQDLSVNDGRYSARADQLQPFGQVIEIGDLNLFVFIYREGTPAESVAAREADAEDLDPETVQITSRQAERPLNEGQEVHIFQHSNIIAVLVGGDDATVQHVEDAINSLP